jgi:methyl-accepting chemotaxis protein
MMDRAEFGSGITSDRHAGFLLQWAERLQSMTDELSRVIPERESNFLDLGRSVMDLSERSRQLAAMATDLAGKASGDDLKESIAELSSALSSLEQRQSVGNASDILQRCTALSGSVTGLQEKMGSFRPMLKRLRVLAMSIRIESARMGTEGKGFVGLASEVEGLGQKTESYSREVEGKTRSLLSSVRQVRGDMASIETMRSQTIDPLLGSLRSSLGEMSRLQEVSESVSASVSDRTKQVSGQIGEIVSSVQFHDITRQQVEHVVQVLDEVREILSGSNQGEFDQEGPEELIHWLGDVSNLQKRQLEATRSELERAMQQIRESLESIQTSIQAEEEDIRRFPGLDSQGGDSVLGRLQQDVADLIETLKRARGSFEEIIQRLDEMASLLDQMETFLDTVEEMSDDIELIALNASIKSAHTGEKGRPLGVLAEAIRKLSYESGEILQDVSTGLQEIASASEQFRSSAESAGTEAREEEDLSRSLETVLQRLQGSNAEVNDLYVSLRRGAGELVERLQSLQSDLAVQYEVERELTKAMDGLQEIETEARQLVPERVRQTRSERLNSILERYTMESERLVHMAFSGLHSEEPPAGDGAVEGAADASDEDDENVELF